MSVSVFPVLFSFLIAGQSCSKIEKSPLIGISCAHPTNKSAVSMNYSEAVIRSGGTPVLIPITTDSLVLTDILHRLDGIILTGGEDVHPSYYNEAPIEQLGEVDSLRDVYDLLLIRIAAQHNTPMLGICRGEQLINVAFGGTLYQDIPTQCSDTTVHHNQEAPSTVPTHVVNVLPDSDLAKATEQTRLFTNTHHHQAVKQVAPGFRATAWATDSIIEGIESTDGRPIWGVQFHPEALTMGGDSIAPRIIRFFIEKVKGHQKYAPHHAGTKLSAD